MLVSPSLLAQDETGVKTVLKLEYLHSDSLHSLTATLKANQEGRYLPLQGMEINFKSHQGNDAKLIGSGISDEKGKATVTIPQELMTTGGDKGIYSFDATYKGKEKYIPSSGITSIKPMKMEISFFQKEGEKMVDLKAYEPDKNNQWVPIEKLDVQFFVPRTFSLLKVGQGTIENGETTFEFPVSIPGNQLGYLTLVAKVEDNEVYGNVEASGTINWGKPLVPEKIVHRGLGDTNAPLWMVYTLIVLLSLVWFHYMYVIYTVFRIRNLGK